MDIKDFIKNLDKYTGPASYHLFESLVLDLVQKYSEIQSKPFIPHYRGKGKIEYDGFAPEGIYDLPGPTAIEIKLLRENIPYKSLRGTIEIAQSEEAIRSFLLIVGKNLTQNQKNKVSEMLRNPNVSPMILDLSDLEHLADDRGFAVNTVSDLSKSIFNNTISKGLKVAPNEWKEYRREYLNQLKQCFNSEGLALFLGSGVSKDAGIPVWNDLMYKLSIELIHDTLSHEMEVNECEETYIIKRLKSINEASPLILAGYIQAGLEDSFREIISKILYKNYMLSNRYSDSLNAISEMCKTGKISSIVTYNFDSLLEEILDEKGFRFKSIYRDVDFPLRNELAIYHVHGFLPRNKAIYEGLSESLLVFSEEGYHSLIKDPYCWSNILQLNLLREKTCLMIGLSVIDPNLRRLLAISAKRIEKPKHYVILERQEFKLSSDTSNEIRDETLREFANIHQKLQEQSFQELGLNIIWIESYDEIPAILESIRG
ncbi:MAG: hypothetical protein HPY61_09945 [Methanotrichaceae archaeon]|nr:hypothetical protein [Methanotrichaceae archaeon]